MRFDQSTTLTLSRQVVLIREPLKNVEKSKRRNLWVHSPYKQSRPVAIYSADVLSFRGAFSVDVFSIRGAIFKRIQKWKCKCIINTFYTSILKNVVSVTPYDISKKLDALFNANYASNCN